MHVMSALAGAAMLVSACSEHTGPTSEDGDPVSSGNVAVQDNQFSPAALVVVPGGTVRWTWQGRNLHNVTFTVGFASATQTSGTYERTFSEVGSFSYICTVHGQAMSGTVTVAAQVGSGY